MTMKRTFALLSLSMLFGVASAWATVTYQGTSVPTFVTASGRAEVAGSVRLTATNTGPSVASTIQFLFQGLGCDNDFSDGVSLSTTGVFALDANVTPGSVTNTAAGCTVSITVKGALMPVVGDFIELDGVRVRVDLTGAVPGTSFNVSLNSTPANSSLFTAPTTLVVATAEPGLTVSAVAGSHLTCLPFVTTPASITLTEGYNASFVQNVVGPAGEIVPAMFRPLNGATNNTEINIVIANLPVGVTLTFPGTVTGSLGALVPGTSGDELELQTPGVGSAPAGNGVITGGGPGTMGNVVYTYLCGNQAVCDINQETFIVTLSSANITVSPSAVVGTATAQAQLYPPLIVGDALLITDPPFPGPPGPFKPRFNDPLKPTPAANFLVIAPCTTTLLFPFTANVLGYDTGIAIANTSLDITNDAAPLVVPVFPTPSEHGSCTLVGFPIHEGPQVSLTTGDISTGDTFTMVLSSALNPMFNGFEGYIIARCNFQFGHGFAFINNPFVPGGPNLAEGYLALIIPDPLIDTGRFANNSAFGGPQSGETLEQ